MMLKAGLAEPSQEGKDGDCMVVMVAMRKYCTMREIAKSIVLVYKFPK
jgi:hypothetical protein